MAQQDRIELIKEIEAIRGSTVICYLTSVRPNAGAQIAEDAVRVFFEHLLLLPERPVKKLDIFLCSNGGNGVVPWRLISLLREFAEEIGVLLPFRAYSAATMLALGADEIVMHPFAEMGPIDPTVSNEFNPINPHTQQTLGISVEDVKAYIGFIKETVGIRHEDELIEAVKILAEKVHPLALGNVERFIAQSRMIARKILLTHMKEDSDRHKIEDTIETLASKLYFHGHPINRREAREELGLKVAEHVPPALETAMWKLYLDFEKELQNDTIFDPMAGIYAAAAAQAAAQAAAHEQAIAAMQAAAAAEQQQQNPGMAGMPGMPIPQGMPGMPVMQGMPVPQVIPVGTATEETNVLAMVESSRLSSSFSRVIRFVVAGTGGQFEPLVRQEVLKQRWDHQSAGT